MHRNPFSDRELDHRLVSVRTAIAESGLDAAILSSPENIFYLTGLDHWGYFAPHMLIVPLQGRPLLLTREMERVTIEKMVRVADFQGHSDAESVADGAASALRDRSLTGRRIGLEFWSAGLSHGLACALRAKAFADWTDISGLVDTVRQVMSAEEQALIRRAAAVTNSATAGAVAAIRDGADERAVAAECLAAMTRAGGEPPGFGPFIRPGSRLGEEHTTWGQGTYCTGETVFLEIAGCVGRYNAPNGRLVHVGPVPDRNQDAASIAEAAFEAVLQALRPGAIARDVYAAWQNIVDDAGLSHYRRHHCGYVVGIAFPPSWAGGNTVTGLRHDSDLMIREGMGFHIMSWLMGCGLGDFFLSNCVLLTDEGPEVLTTTPHLNSV